MSIPGLSPVLVRFDLHTRKKSEKHSENEPALRQETTIMMFS